MTETSTNQVFPILPKSLIEKLLKKYSFHVGGEIDKDYSAIRLITSWATGETKVDEFINDLRN